jgi:hypothetical protein
MVSSPQLCGKSLQLTPHQHIETTGNVPISYVPFCKIKEEDKKISPAIAAGFSFLGIEELSPFDGIF